MAKGTKIPTQPDGMPQGRHMTGFKGSKVEGTCLCGKCHPNAVKGKEYVRIITPKTNAKTSVTTR